MAHYGTDMSLWMPGPHVLELHHHHNIPEVASTCNGNGHGRDAPRLHPQPMIHIVNDVRPRLTKEQHDVLEAHFQQQNKPSTNTKRAFADTLGVPLDKINNWFQNRRAKVKQDAKRLINATNEYHQLALAQMNKMNEMNEINNINEMTEMGEMIDMTKMTEMTEMAEMDEMPEIDDVTDMDEMSNQKPPQPHEFFAANPHIDPPVFVAGIPRPVDMNTPNFAISQQPPQLLGPLASNPESVSHHAATSHDDIMRSLEISACSLSAMDVSAMSHRPYAAFEGSDQLIFNPQFNMATSVQDFAQYQVQNASHDAIDFQSYSATPMQATHSNDSTPSTHSNMTSTHSTMTMDSSVGALPMPTVSTEWADDVKPPIQFPTSPYDMSNVATMPQQAYSSPPEDQSAYWVHNQHPHFEEQFQRDDTTSSTWPRELPPSPAQSEQKPQVGDDLIPNSHMLTGAFSARPSSPSGLAESMNNVGIQTRSNSVDSEFKQPVPPSTIAARRQRPKPATLGQAALRSVSYSPRMSASPGANGNLNAPADQSLRRIRSSGVPGLNGRIQKTGNGSGQRSPLRMGFADAAASPKFARHATFATVASPGQPSLAPPTPMTPNDAARFPSWQSHHGSMHSHNSMDHGSPNAIAMSWASESPAMFPTHAAYSPPVTPADAEQHKVYVHNAMYRDTPPQSAPAKQQYFSVIPLPAYPEPLAVNHAHSSHIRRPSLPDGHMTAQPSPLFHQPTGDMPLTFQAMPYDRLHVPLPHVTVPSQTTAAYPMPSHLASVPLLANHGAMLAPDFAVHEYTPPLAAGRARDSVSPCAREFNIVTPKVFHFANAGPKDFQCQTAL